MSCNIAAAVTDALISVVLVYYLSISKTGVVKTDDMLNRLVRVRVVLVISLSIIPPQIAFTFNTGMWDSDIHAPPYYISSTRSAHDLLRPGRLHLRLWLVFFLSALPMSLQINAWPQTFIYIFWFLMRTHFLSRFPP
jgi:hypothetical protein